MGFNLFPTPTLAMIRLGPFRYFYHWDFRTGDFAWRLLHG